MPSVLPPLAVGTVLGSRYRLEDVIVDGQQRATWRGFDQRLNRRVSVRLLAGDDPDAGAVTAAAHRAAQVEGRHLVPVLDLITTAEFIAVISDWTDWPTIGYLIGDRLDPHAAVDVARQVCSALAVLADHGIAHGRLRPDNIHMDGHGQVRLRGQQVDAALRGLTSDQDVLRRNDALGALAVLYLALTGVWPEAGNGVTHDFAPSQPPLLTPPSRLVAGIPAVFDALLVNGFRKAHDGDLDIPGIMSALAVAQDSLAEPTPKRVGPAVTMVFAGRAMLVVVVGLAIAALAAAGITQASQERSSAPERIAIATDDGVVSATTEKSVPVGPTETVLPIARMTTLDPDGDGSEYPHLLSNIIDDDAGSAWTSKPYFTEDVGGKRGVGVVFDLGENQPVSALELDLIGTSTDFTVAVGPDPNGEFEDFLPVAQVNGAGQTVFVRLPRVAESRAVLVWFTHLSPVSTSAWDDSGYRAGIRHATLYGRTEGG